MDVLNQHILANPVLAEYVQKTVRKTGAINLIHPNWLEVLKASEIYRKHESRKVQYTIPRTSEKIEVQSIIGPENYFDVLVAGYFSLSLQHVDYEKPNKIHHTSFLVRNCPPIVAIAGVMTKHSEQIMQSNCKFFVDRCNPNICSTCAKYASMLTGADDNWCIITSRLYDGVQIRNVFKSKIEQTFGQLSNFVGIMRICVNARIGFNNTGGKIGGSVKEFVVFKDSVLANEQDVVVNPYIEVDPPLPSIAYPNTPSITPTSDGSHYEDDEIHMAVPESLIRRRR